MNAWVFDVDGVLTNPTEKQTPPEIIDKLSSILEKGEILAFNTGRSVSWVQERVLSKLEAKVTDKNLFHNMLLVGEKGNTILVYEGSQWKTHVVGKPMPQELIDSMRSLIEDKYHETTFFDDSKLTMISTEMKDNADHDVYTKQQHELNDNVQNLISGTQYKDLKLRIDPTIIALDIQFEDAGKHLGARRIEDWMQEKGYKVEKVFMVGDSVSDIEMAEELQHLYPVTFVFVNDPKKLEGKSGEFEIVYTDKKFDQGTLEFLNTHL